MAKIEGSCLCGGVHYSADADPMAVVNCYCSTCQKNTGSTHSYNYAMPSGSVTITGETLKVYEDRAGASGKPFFRSFCGTCGSPVLGKGEAYPGMEFVKAGTLDGAQSAPVMHIWCDEKQPWQELPAGATQFPRNPG